MVAGAGPTRPYPVSKCRRTGQIYFQMNRSYINRNLHSMDHLELWLLMAIATVFALRLFLVITGYPQVGGSVLHIAHVLWGGLLMAVGTITLFAFVGKIPETLGTMASGIGFGLFIDEVGKFVTKDNNYFFQPSVAIMYTVFVLLYIIARWVLTSIRYSETEYLVNSINEMREIPVGAATIAEKRTVLYDLGNSNPANPLVRDLKQLVERIETTGSGRHGLYVRWRDAFIRGYSALTSKTWFTRVIAGFFILQFIGTLSIVLAVLFDAGQVASDLDGFGFADWAILASNAISAVYITWGILLLKRSRLRAYMMFDRSVLVQLLLGEVFLFYKDEFGALPGFIFYLLLLLAIRLVLRREKNAEIEAHVASANPMD